MIFTNMNIDGLMKLYQILVIKLAGMRCRYASIKVLQERDYSTGSHPR